LTWIVVMIRTALIATLLPPHGGHGWSQLLSSSPHSGSIHSLSVSQRPRKTTKLGNRQEWQLKLCIKWPWRLTTYMRMWHKNYVCRVTLKLQSLPLSKWYQSHTFFLFLTPPCIEDLSGSGVKWIHLLAPVGTHGTRSSWRR
jgi:hypothetical protein